MGEGGAGAGVMTTESGLTITGDAHGNVLALETSNGRNAVACGHGSADAELSYQL